MKRLSQNLKNMKIIFIHLLEFHLYKTVIHKEKGLYNIYGGGKRNKKIA